MVVPTIQKECIVGGPVTAVSLLVASDDNHHHATTQHFGGVNVVVVYGQGPFLHRVHHHHHTMPNIEPKFSKCDHQQQQHDSNNSNIHSEEQLLVFGDGGSIHGIRHDNDQPPPTTSTNNHLRNGEHGHRRPQDDGRILTVVFGGRTMAVVRNVVVAHQRMRVCPIRTIPTTTNSGSSSNSSKRSHCLTVSDWIWECRLVWGGDTTHSRRSRSDSDQCGPTTTTTAPLATTMTTTIRTLVVGLAHNTVQIWKLTLFGNNDDDDDSVMEAHLWHCLQGTTRCISYSMAFHCDWRTQLTPPPPNSTTVIRLAVGTATNEIVVWSFPCRLDEDAASRPSELQRSRVPSPEDEQFVLRGHRGVIHALRFHQGGPLQQQQQQSLLYLASTSDDRTVRLWQEQRPSTTTSTSGSSGGGWLLLWTAYGHTARGWDVSFATLSSSSSFLVLSTGEDGTMRVWGPENGEALAVKRGHACQCVWSVDTASRHDRRNDDSSMISDYVAVTGGNDGTVALYNLGDCLLEQQQKSNGIIEERCLQSTFLVPDDRPLVVSKPAIDSTADSQQHDCTPPLEILRKTKETRPKKVFQQVIVGMKFASPGCAFSRAGSTLIVATRSGSVWSLDTACGDWTPLEPWWWETPDSVTDGAESAGQMQATDGCCMCLHPTMSIGAIGTTRGDIVLTRLRQKSKTIVDTSYARCHVMLCAREHRSVQKLEWVTPDVLLSFHVRALLWWKFSKLAEKSNRRPPDDNEAKVLLGNCTVLTLQTGVKGLSISYAFDKASSRLVVGDTRGNLSLFDLTCLVDSDGIAVSPASVLRGVHHTEHVAAILWKNSDAILSVGNDGHIVECAVNSCGILVKLLSVPVGSFTGISYIWSVQQSPTKSNIVVGGYRGNVFAVFDVSSGYEHFCVDTGGRQRALDIYAGDGQILSLFPSAARVAICQTRVDGRNDIHLNRRGLTALSTPNESASVPVLRHSIGVPLHGESCFDARLFPLDAACKSLALLTGSEDCSSKITLYRGGVIESSKLLPPQVSGIRAVCCSRFDVDSTIIVVGGKVNVQAYLVRDLDPQSKTLEIDVKFLGNGIPQEKPTIDHRINCVGAVRVSSNAGDLALIVAGDSNGSCYIYLFSSELTSSSGRLLYRDERPILSLDLIRCDSRYLLLLGGTSGSVTVFDLPGDTAPNAWLDISHTPLLRYSAHSMGTNTITARLKTSSDGSRFLRICSGGDDQAICCCDVHLNTNELGVVDFAFVLRTSWAKEAAMSALKGVEFVDERHLVATGYDQRLSVWHCDDHVLVKLVDVAVDIGDVNCLAHCIIGNGNHLVAVGGAGVELLSIVL